ncbi:MAG TPA: thiol peroxidase [bacterium]|nr:thiol peroxidase [bacterium]
MQERKGVQTFKGGPLTLLGPEIKVGDTAPNFKVLTNKLEEVTLDNYKGKTLILSVAPSLDTSVCSLQTQRFNKETANLPASVEVLTITADLPFAQARFCGAENIKIQTLSDHRDMSFADAYGTHIKELRLEARSIFVVGKDGKVKYVEYVPEMTSHPDYDKALAAAKANA